MTRLSNATARREEAFVTTAEPGFLTILTALAIAGMMIVAAVPHASGQVRQSNDTVIQMSASGTATDPHETCRARAQDEMTDWRSKMQAFDEKVQTGSTRHIDAAERRLRSAWDDTEVEARNVQAATARGWEYTTRAYEAASRRLTAAWVNAQS